jgi:hypothetical protein
MEHPPPPDTGGLTPRRSPLDAGPIAISNSIRLTGQQWIGIGVFAVLLILLAPPLWKQFEAFPLEADYRMPRDFGHDYWLYERYAGLAAAKYDTLILGDSVVWGEYTKRHETLSHYLNRRAGRERYANLGLDGAHPLALAGLIQHYAAGIRGKSVMLHCNPMWLHDAKPDLQGDRADVNHPRLVPQFFPRIPAYQEEVSQRLGILVEQRLPFNKWTNHLQQAYYERTDIPGWTKDHPYDNPLAPLTRGLPSSNDVPRYLPKPWFEGNATKRDFPWVDLNSSLQWPAFRHAVEVLKKRDNRVFVVVGPFNEHMLTLGSLERYQKIKTAIAAWLQDEQIPHAVPQPLPSELYADASHPLAAGYDLLAEKLLEDPAFQALGTR